MLGDPFRDEPEASTWALRAIAEEEIAAIGHLRGHRDAIVVDARSSQVRRCHQSKIEARTISAVGRERSGNVFEVDGDLGAYLIARRRD